MNTPTATTQAELNAKGIIAQAVQDTGFVPEADPVEEMKLASRVSELVYGYYNGHIAQPLQDCRYFTKPQACRVMAEALRRYGEAMNTLGVVDHHSLDAAASTLIDEYRKATA